ncbi:MAG TPA: Plug domain-containing protein, partial [Novosphingobium sp.]|nr:Plug domain-containing protein [Novosphingobium sp.]
MLDMGLAAGAARAETAAPASPSAEVENAGAQVPELVVTARKRDENLLKVPVAINAVSAEAISQQNIASLQDVARYTPSLMINDVASNQATRNNQQITMRGMYAQGSP